MSDAYPITTTPTTEIVQPTTTTTSFPRSLPETGMDIMPLVSLAVGLIIIGFAIATRNRVLYSTSPSNNQENS